MVKRILSLQKAPVKGKHKKVSYYLRYTVTETYKKQSLALHLFFLNVNVLENTPASE